MNETIMTALGTAVTTLTAALAAAQAGRFDEARELLSSAGDHMEEGQGGNAAHAARRRKALRLEAEVRALLPEQQELPSGPDAPAAQPAVGSAPRGVAPPHHLSDEGWVLVGQALRAEGRNAETLEAQAQVHEAAWMEAEALGQRYAAKVARRLSLQARAEAAALRNDPEAANTAWDRLFDVVTALRGAEGKARRTGQPSGELARNYNAAREDTLKIRRWARGASAT